MIGIAIGVVFSLVIFTIYPKDTLAINEHKRKRK
jgi:tetrahydromethanopterin S-methyltransferase subunit F